MAFIIDTINGSGLYAQSAASASVATYDSNGNAITATYLTAHQPISADEWNNVYDTVNVYSGSWTGSESSPTASVDSNGSIDIVSSNNTVYFDVNGTWFNNAVNSAVDVPTGVMVESACEYNAVNEISGYNGSAIAQYGADKQWLQHDDTIVHVANSSQYAFGCNVSALQILMGIDETVLWEGVMSATGVTAYLNYPARNFNKIKIYAYPNISFSGQRPQQVKEFVPGKYTATNNFYYVKTDNIESNVYYGEIIYLLFGTNNDFTLSPGCRWQGNTYTTGINTYRGAVTKIVGIGRKQ